MDCVFFLLCVWIDVGSFGITQGPPYFVDFVLSSLPTYGEDVAQGNDLQSFGRMKS